ncbi:MAG: hypothetical protein ISS49_17070 [Anaerolineae bacterium]|nr:hypothetical protein [Anaerolineae bacterium]
MGFVVLDTDVLSSASPGESERAQKGWRLLQCLIDECHFLLVSPGLWQEYRHISAHSTGRRKLARYAFAKVEMASEPLDKKARERLEQLGVDEKDVGWVLLAAEREAVFVTWEKYAPRRRKSAEREQEHQRIVRAVEDEFHVRIWHPDYALRRLCPQSK